MGSTNNTSEQVQENWFIKLFHVTKDQLPISIAIIVFSIIFIFFIIALLWWLCYHSKENKSKRKESVNISTIDGNISQISNNYSTFNPELSNTLQRNISLGIVEIIPEFDVPAPWPSMSVNQRDKKRFRRNARSARYYRNSCVDKIGNRQHDFINDERPTSFSVVSSHAINVDCLPQISEFNPNIDSNHDGCLSADALNNYRTRSLPTCVRQKREAVPNSGESVADLYDKVNFSKKRRNRMRNDEAAIIAMSKSRSQLFDKDTDSLVDNEAVIVYDERTAL